MNGKDYLMTQMSLIEMGKRASVLDLDAFLKCISNAEAVAPMLDPTAYIKAKDNLDAVRKLAEAFLGVKAAFAQTQEAVLKTTVAYMMGKETPQ